MRCRNGTDVNPTSGFSMAIGPSQARLISGSAHLRLGSRLVLQLVVHPQRVGQHLFPPDPDRFLPARRVASPAVPCKQILPGHCRRFRCNFHLHVGGCHVPVVVSDIPHLNDHSQHVEHLCLRLDMLCVVIFILGDLVLGIYLVFWCEPLPRNIYWSMVSYSQPARFRAES
jgi:hypothetical protein